MWSQQGAKIAARNPSSTPRNALDHTSELDRDVHVGWQSRATLGMGLHRRGVLEGNRQVRKRATREKGSRGPESYKPSSYSDAMFDTDTYTGFSGGEVAPWIPGSRFKIFDN